MISRGSFSAMGVNQDERVKPSSLLINKSQRNRIQARNELATSRHIQKNRIDDKIKTKELKTSLKTLGSTRSSDDNERKIDKPKLRDLKQKELAAKLEFLQKLREKDQENSAILKLSKSILRHHEQRLHQERKTAINMLSKIETVIVAETEAPKPPEPSTPPVSRLSRSQPKSTPLTQHVAHTEKNSTSIFSEAVESKQIPSTFQSEHQQYYPPQLSPSRDSFPLSLSDLCPDPIPTITLQISNSVPFSTQPSFLDEENDSICSSTTAHTSFFEEIIIGTDDKPTQDKEEFPNLPDEINPTSKIYLEEEILPAPAPESAKASVMSKLWAMSAEDSDEVSESEWD